MPNKKETIAFRENWIIFIHDLQNRICEALEREDGRAKFIEDEWERAEGRGGGGKTRVIADGAVFEKGGVNTSVVYGHVTDKMRKYLKMEGSKWFACGLSLVIHPLNPYVPTVHANWRYFELYDENGDVCDRWFGGGADLTPYYLFVDDACHFHSVWKTVMDPFGTELYPKYKKWCDEYFTNTHRNHEMRGVGGVFTITSVQKMMQKPNVLPAFNRKMEMLFSGLICRLFKKEKTIHIPKSRLPGRRYAGAGMLNSISCMTGALYSD